jgi:hypothetical protein
MAWIISCGTKSMMALYFDVTHWPRIRVRRCLKIAGGLVLKTLHPLLSAPGSE